MGESRDMSRIYIAFQGNRWIYGELGKKECPFEKRVLFVAIVPQGYHFRTFFSEFITGVHVKITTTFPFHPNVSDDHRTFGEGILES